MTHFTILNIPLKIRYTLGLKLTSDTHNCKNISYFINLHLQIKMFIICKPFDLHKLRVWKTNNIQYCLTTTRPTLEFKSAMDIITQNHVFPPLLLHIILSFTLTTPARAPPLL